jgi:hypothetical protein
MFWARLGAAPMAPRKKIPRAIAASTIHFLELLNIGPPVIDDCSEDQGLRSRGAYVKNVLRC